MPIPPALTNKTLYGQCWTGRLTVGPNVRDPGRGIVTKNFTAYVENYEQSAHDAQIAKYIKRLGGGSRSPHRAQVRPANNSSTTPLVYYATHGEMASKLAAAELQRGWTTAAAAGSTATVFPAGQAKALTVQGVRQTNGFNYEVTMWYDGDDIYVAFHCYAP